MEVLLPQTEILSLDNKIYLSWQYQSEQTDTLCLFSVHVSFSLLLSLTSSPTALKQLNEIKSHPFSLCAYY